MNYTSAMNLRQQLILITLNSVRLSGVGDRNRTCFHGFAIQCLSNWLHLHNSGTACRNRTHIRTLEECCPIRWTNAVWCGYRDSNSENSDFKSDMYTNSIISAKLWYPCWDSNSEQFLLLRETTFPICPQGHGGLKENWTLTRSIMSRLLYH